MGALKVLKRYTNLTGNSEALAPLLTAANKEQTTDTFTPANSILGSLNTVAGSVKEDTQAFFKGVAEGFAKVAGNKVLCSPFVNFMNALSKNTTMHTPSFLGAINMAITQFNKSKNVDHICMSNFESKLKVLTELEKCKSLDGAKKAELASLIAEHLQSTSQVNVLERLAAAVNAAENATTAAKAAAEAAAKEAAAKTAADAKEAAAKTAADAKEAAAKAATALEVLKEAINPIVIP